MANPILLITGGNAGIGLAAVKELCKSSIAYTILLGSRDQKKGEDAIATVQSEVPNSPSTLSVIQIDVTDDDTIQKAYQNVESTHGKLDILVNNAGVSLDVLGGKTLTSRQIWNNSWDINVAGSWVMTETFAPLLLKSDNPRLLFVTSGASCLRETETAEGPMFARLNGSPDAGWPKTGLSTSSYRSTKTGMNMMMREWHRLLKNDNVKVWAISPGFLATNLGGVGPDVLKQMGAGEVSVGGEFIRDVIEGKRDDDVGRVVRRVGIQEW